MQVAGQPGLLHFINGRRSVVPLHHTSLSAKANTQDRGAEDYALMFLPLDWLGKSEKGSLINETKLNQAFDNIVLSLEIMHLNNDVTCARLRKESSTGSLALLLVPRSVVHLLHVPLPTITIQGG